MAKLEPARPTWSSTPQPPAETPAACLPLLVFSRRRPHLTVGTGQDLLLSRTVIASAREAYVDRFACDWHRLVARVCPDRRNHGPGRTPYRDRSPCTKAAKGVHLRIHRAGERRRVAATTADETTAKPTLSRARWASLRVAPVVSTSSQTTIRDRGRSRASRRWAGTEQAIDRARLAARSEACRPAWSTTPGSIRSSGQATASTTSCAEGGGRSPGHRVRRVVPAGPHAGPARRHRHQHQRARGVRGGHCLCEQARQWSAQREQAMLLVADHHRPNRALVGARRERCHQPRRCRRGPGDLGAYRQQAGTVTAEQSPGLGAAHTMGTQQQVAGRVGKHG